MSSDNWVRTFNLLGSALAFYGSYRAQLWLKEQARTFERDARESTTANEHVVPASPASDKALGDPKEFRRVLKAVAATPFFDRWAYLLLCVGFGVSTLSGLYDLIAHTLLGPSTP
jgi:hypothetical protein